MPFTEPNENRKVSLSISEYADSILKEDQFNFKNDSRSGIINRIFKNFKFDAKASISIALDKKKNELTLLLCEQSFTDKEQLISILLKNYESALTEELHDFIKRIPSVRKTSFKIRINNENIEYLLDFDCKENIFYNDHISRYFNTILEEYAKKTYYEREEIYYKEELALIQSTISNQTTIKAKLIKKDTYAPIRIAPCAVVSDSQNLYHYILAYRFIENNETIIRQPYAFRLSRLYDIKAGSGKKAGLTQTERRDIESLVEKKGIQFLNSNNDQTIHVWLSPAGVKKYHSLQHLRPTYIQKENLPNGEVLLEFDCTESQIEFYFFKFGADAFILEPQTLQDKFAAMYNQAAQIYKNKIIS